MKEYDINGDNFIYVGGVYIVKILGQDITVNMYKDIEGRYYTDVSVVSDMGGEELIIGNVVTPIDASIAEKWETDGAIPLDDPESANVKLPMDKELKESMEKVCTDMGLTMTEAFIIFAKTVCREKRIPFEITADLF